MNTSSGTAPPAIRSRRRATTQAFAIGGIGGAVFAWLQLPLAWMIGSLAFTMAAAIGGMRLDVPKRLRTLMIMVLGVMLGSAFTPAILGHLDDWVVTLSALVAYIGASLAAGLAYLRRVAGYDRVTAFFTAAPGGFSEMVMAGGALGGDERLISLAHSLRITIVVMAIPFWFQSFAGYEPAARSGVGPAFAGLPWRDALMLAACALGALPARRLGLPAPMMFGPMIASAGIHLAGLTESKPPGVVVAAAMVVIGASIGARFVGVPIRVLGRSFAVAGGLTALLLAVTVAFAAGLHGLTGLPVSSLVLAYAPGGFVEMSLVSLALGLDPAFVSTHHMARIFLVIALVPLSFRLLQRWWRTPSARDSGPADP